MSQRIREAVVRLGPIVFVLVVTIARRWDP